MTTKTVARCRIYEERPEICRVYPKVDHYIPPQCTYYFKGEERQGSCACDDGACCASPRKDGEPGGIPMPQVSGGLPCKHLVWTENEQEKTAEPMVKIANQQESSVGVLERCIYDP